MNLLYLRARWYAVETGTFLSRDPVEGEPPYLYGRGNPTNIIDPSGLYGANVHDTFTYGSAAQISRNLGFSNDNDLVSKLADEIATGDQHVDDAVGMLDAVIGCNDCHFAPLRISIVCCPPE